MMLLTFPSDWMKNAAFYSVIYCERDGRWYKTNYVRLWEWSNNFPIIDQLGDTGWATGCEYLISLQIANRPGNESASDLIRLTLIGFVEMSHQSRESKRCIAGIILNLFIVEVISLERSGGFESFGWPGGLIIFNFWDICHVQWGEYQCLRVGRDPQCRFPPKCMICIEEILKIPFNALHFLRTSVSSEGEAIEKLIRSGGGYLIARLTKTGYVISQVDIVVVHQKQSRPSQLYMLKLINGGI